MNNFWKNFVKGVVDVFIFKPHIPRLSKEINLKSAMRAVSYEINKAFETYSNNESK